MVLPGMDVASRIDRLRAGFDGAGCDGFLVTNPTNTRYLTGFTGSAGVLLVTGTRTLLVTDGRYATQSAEQLGANEVDADIEIGSVAEQQQALAAAVAGTKRLGLEAGSVTWGQQRTYVDLFGALTELVPADGLVEVLRRTKDAGELARIEAACAIADQALADTKKQLLDLPTEREFGLELDFTMRRLGASDVSFETIVAAGPNGAKPHARPSDRRIEAGELIVLDFGALVDGYHSDMTRTVCVGEPKTPKLQQIFDLVLESQAAGVGMVTAGVGARDVDTACREVITDAGFGEWFVHGTGHGVGLDIHEFPILGMTATANVGPGFVVTVEPGVYLPDEGGVRIEDSVVVTPDGCRRLTNAPKDLVIC